MLEKNSKISVLRKMIGLAGELEPQFIVPQNSLSNLRHKMGLCERNTPVAAAPMTSTKTSMTGAALISDSKNRQAESADHRSNVNKCPHCENMAKNFLYLESLIRSNYNPRYSCSLCYSSLKYLQYVNKSIMEVFGNFDSIVEAAKAFARPQKRTFRVPKQRSKLSSQSITTANVSTGALVKKKSRASHLSLRNSKHKATTANRSRFSLQGDLKRAKSHNKLKQTAKQTKSRHNVRSAVGSVFENGEKFIRSKRAKGSKSNVILRSFKQKNITATPNKVSVTRVRA